jgi:hypothetical protein
MGRHPPPVPVTPVVALGWRGIADRKGSDDGHSKGGQTGKCRNGLGPHLPTQPEDEREPGKESS